MIRSDQTKDLLKHEEILIGNTAKTPCVSYALLYDKEMRRRLTEKAKVEAGKRKIEWGVQIRSYVFGDRRVKDHRTNYRTSGVNGVMDGKIDDSVKAYLMEFAGTIAEK
jgi:peptide chain release factor 2